MSKAVFRYEGTIAQLQGDAMLAFFGAPVAHEDDPERAVRAALDMVAEIDEFARQLKAVTRHRLPDPRRHQHRAGHRRQRRQRPALRVHGARRRGERGRPGPDRRRSRARSSSSDRTQRFVDDAFDFDDLGDGRAQGQGRAGPAVPSGRRQAPSRADGAAWKSVGLSSPLVGRSAELDSSDRAASTVASAGRGRLAVLHRRTRARQVPAAGRAARAPWPRPELDAPTADLDRRALRQLRPQRCRTTWCSTWCAR